jgi:hypothetical protein
LHRDVPYRLACPSRLVSPRATLHDDAQRTSPSPNQTTPPSVAPDVKHRPIGCGFPVEWWLLERRFGVGGTDLSR